MTDIELMLRLLELKAGHFWGCSFTYAQAYGDEEVEGKPSAVTREELYDAKAEALRDFVTEVRAWVGGTPVQSPVPPPRAPNQRFAFITDMAGTLSATVFNSQAELDDARDRFDRDHEGYGTIAKSAHDYVVINPRARIPAEDALSTGILDVRLVLITDVDGDLQATVYDTEAELQLAIDAFRDDYAFSIDRQEAVASSHEIIIPPRPVPAANGGDS